MKKLIILLALISSTVFSSEFIVKEINDIKNNSIKESAEIWNDFTVDADDAEANIFDITNRSKDSSFKKILQQKYSTDSVWQAFSDDIDFDFISNVIDKLIETATELIDYDPEIAHLTSYEIATRISAAISNPAVLFFVVETGSFNDDSNYYVIMIDLKNNQMTELHGGY